MIKASIEDSLFGIKHLSLCMSMAAEAGRKVAVESFTLGMNQRKTVAACTGKNTRFDCKGPDVTMEFENVTSS